jgi:hypothetical protein
MSVVRLFIFEAIADMAGTSLRGVLVGSNVDADAVAGVDWTRGNSAGVEGFGDQVQIFPS